MGFRFGVALAFVVCVFITTAAPAADEALVRQFYPQRLVDDFRAFDPDNPLAELFSSVRADLGGTGTAEFVVGAYSNGRMGAIRVLRLNAAGAVLVDDVDLPLVGARPKVVALDLDSDRKQEIIASFQMHRATWDWVFKWTGTRLASIGPSSVSHGVLRSELWSVEAMDVDADGKHELFIPIENEEGVASERMFSIRDGAFANSPVAVVLHDRYERHEGEPETIPARFKVADASSSFTLVFTNGDSGGHEVTSGEVRLNGKAVVAPDDFKRKVKTIKVPVRLAAENELEVELRGEPGGFVTFVIMQGQ